MNDAEVACSIALVTGAADLARVHGVMVELRTHLTRDAFVAQVERQQRNEGYRLAALTADGQVHTLAGYRFLETLAWGRILYVDDLVTRAADRGSGFGGRMLDWLVAEARTAGCAQLHLDSGVQRFAAHRFYLGKGLDITSHHFAMRLDQDRQA